MSDPNDRPVKGDVVEGGAGDREPSEVELRAARFVDGALDASERQAFEVELAEDPALQSAVDELAAVRGWFAPGRAAESTGLGPGFADRVVAGVLADSVSAAGSGSAAGSLAAGGGAADAEVAASGAVLALREDAVLRTARRVAWAAAVLLVACLAAWSGILRIPGHGRLEASTQEIRDAMQDLDARSAERLEGAPAAASGREAPGERR